MDRIIDTHPLKALPKVAEVRRNTHHEEPHAPERSVAILCYISLWLPVAQVRYDANSEFREHGHPDGEEILVLEGSWQGD